MNKDALSFSELRKINHDLEKENCQLREYKIFYDGVFSKSIAIPTEEYSQSVEKLKLLEEENSELKLKLVDIHIADRTATSMAKIQSLEEKIKFLESELAKERDKNG